MKSSVEQLSDTRVKLTVEVPFDELTKEIDAAYKAIAQQVNIPGFRRGKAPRKIIDARFGRGVVLEQIINDMLPTRYQNAVEENELQPVGQPEIDITKIEDGDLVEFVAEVEVRPTFDLPDFNSYKLEVAAADESAVSDRVDDELNALTRRFAEYTPVEDEIKDGDRVEVKAWDKESESHEDAVFPRTVFIGEDTLDWDIKELIGHKVGDEFETTQTEQSAKGEGEDGDDEKSEPKKLQVRVEKADRPEYPEIDDDFIQEATAFDTVDEYRENQTEEARQGLRFEQLGDARDKLVEKALADVKIPLPEGLVERQVSSQREGLITQFGGDAKALDEYFKAINTTREQFDKQTREQVEESIRLEFLLDALAEENDITLNQDEFVHGLSSIAANYGMDPTMFVQSANDAGQIGAIYADLRRNKAVGQLLRTLDVVDDKGDKVDFNDLFEDDEEDITTEANDAKADEAKESDADTKAEDNDDNKDNDDE